MSFDFQYPWTNMEGGYIKWIPDVSAIGALGSTFECVVFTVLTPSIYETDIDQVALLHRTYLLLQEKLEEPSLVRFFAAHIYR